MIPEKVTPMSIATPPIATQNEIRAWLETPGLHHGGPLPYGSPMHNQIMIYPGMLHPSIFDSGMIYGQNSFNMSPYPNQTLFNPMSRTSIQYFKGLDKQGSMPPEAMNIFNTRSAKK